MTTIAELTQRINRELLIHNLRPRYDLPSSGIGTSTTSLVLSTVDQITVGSILDCSFELMYVTNWEAGTRTATVIRGFEGSTARAIAATDLVAINPQIPTVAIYDGILAELRSWDERLFVVEQETLSFGASDTTIECTPTRDPYRVLYARADPYSTYSQRKWLNGELRRSEPAAEFASGYSLSIPSAFGTATSVFVAYALPFDLSALTTTTDLVATTGLTEGMCEILVWGALMRATAGKQIGRLDNWAAARLGGEQTIPAMAPLQASAEYRRQRDLCFSREATKLLAQWPYRFNG
jgi:hypothetical protein